jgi:hypothetical protein
MTAHEVAFAITGIFLSVPGFIATGVTEHQEKEDEKEAADAAKASADADTAKKRDWSLENLRKQLDDPNASWNRGLAAPSPAKPSNDPSDTPRPGR